MVAWRAGQRGGGGMPCNEGDCGGGNVDSVEIFLDIAINSVLSTPFL